MKKKTKKEQEWATEKASKEEGTKHLGNQDIAKHKEHEWPGMRLDKTLKGPDQGNARLTLKLGFRPVGRAIKGIWSRGIIKSGLRRVNLVNQ